jgi:hypothetical protein
MYLKGMRICLLVLFVPILFLSCREDDSATPNPHAAKILAEVNCTDTFYYDFPRVNTYYDKFIREQKQKSERLLDFQPIEKGFDSIQIRMWFSYDYFEYLLILQNDKKEWSANFCTFEPVYSKKFDSIVSLKKACRYKTPKSGWIRLVDSLFSLQILTLPDYHKIPGYKEYMPNDVTGATVELATKKVYRYYDLFEPEFMRDKFRQAEKMSSILHLIDQEFDLNLFQLKELKHKTSNTKGSTDTIKVHEITLRDIKEDSAPH